MKKEKKKKICFDKNRTQSLLTDNIQKKKRLHTHTHTHIQTDKNSICDFIECGFFIA